MSLRPAYDPTHLRYLAGELRREAGVIERHNLGLKRAEADNLFFPVERSANQSRIENLNEAADLLDALAERKTIKVIDPPPPKEDLLPPAGPS